MPTSHYGWTLPTEGQDPWYSTMDTLFNAIDTSVHSVQTGMVTHMTMVISAYPNPALFIPNVANVGAGGTWLVLSAAPYGRFVGSFSLVTSGAQAAFDLRITGDFSTFIASLQETRFRLFVSNGVNSFVVPSDSAWISVITFSGLSWVLPPFTSIVSLGPGKFSCEVQATTTTSTFLVLDPVETHFAILLVDEMRL